MILMLHQPDSFVMFHDVSNISALKAVETLAIRHVKGSREYRDGMRTELKKYSTMNVILLIFTYLNI